VITAPVGPELLQRTLALVDAHTTEFAEDVLRVPLSYYRDPQVFERERSELCRHVPLALAVSAQLTAPHDFVVREVLGTSVLISRGADGVARAFLNYCRHRGGKPAQGCGNARRHTCPYHAWTYDSSGHLVGLPGAEGFDSIDRAEYPLVALPAEERHGLVWVVLTATDSIDVAAHLGSLDAELSTWNLGASEYLTEREFEASVNWKAAIEAFAEDYHFPYVHANSLVGQNVIGNTAIYDGYGQHHRLGFPTPWITTARTDADPTAAEAQPLGYMVFIYWIFPNLTLAMSPVGTEIIDILPGTSPGHCVMRHGWMSHTPSPDDATRAGYADLYELVHAAVRDEDFGVLPGCGEGSQQGQHDHMLIGRNEIGVQHVVTTFHQALDLPLSPPTPS